MPFTATQTKKFTEDIDQAFNLLNPTKEDIMTIFNKYNTKQTKTPRSPRTPRTPTTPKEKKINVKTPHQGIMNIGEAGYTSDIYYGTMEERKMVRDINIFNSWEEAYEVLIHTHEIYTQHQANSIVQVKAGFQLRIGTKHKINNRSTKRNEFVWIFDETGNINFKGQTYIIADYLKQLKEQDGVEEEVVVEEPKEEVVVEEPKEELVVEEPKVKKPFKMSKMSKEQRKKNKRIKIEAERKAKEEEEERKAKEEEERKAKEEAERKAKEEEDEESEDEIEAEIIIIEEKHYLIDKKTYELYDYETQEPCGTYRNEKLMLFTE